MTREAFSGPRTTRRPLFESGLIAEPLIAFGGQHNHIDPKVGLGLYGPYSLKGQSQPVLASITVGCVGPPAMLGDAQRWLAACQSSLMNDGSEPFLNPHFPGMNAGMPFQCELKFGQTWQEAVAVKDLAATLRAENFYERIRRVIDLYVAAMRVLMEREPRPQVVLYCIPEDVIALCTVRITQAGEVKRRRVSSAEQAAIKEVKSGQSFLFTSMDPTLGIEDDMGGHENLRRGLKAEGMRFDVPTQLVWPRTLKLIDDPEIRDAQDVATRAWNFTTALYHKAGGVPWRLAEVEPGTCFVGVSFYRELEEKNPKIRTAMAQAFTSSGDGYVLRGASFEWDEGRDGRSPHLDAKSAAGLMQDVIDLYKRQNRGSLPNRVVVHKTSRFWDEELSGFESAVATVPQHDFVALGWRGIQLYRPGLYPPLRGTYVKISNSDLLLYSVGYVPFLRTYAGARVPHPLEIVEHHGNSPWTVVLEELMGLTKMNWNTASFACSEPITVAFSRKVGQILAELGPRKPMRPEYRFYM